MRALQDKEVNEFCLLKGRCCRLDKSRLRLKKRVVDCTLAVVVFDRFVGMEPCSE
jgi:hypothetical protein